MRTIPLILCAMACCTIAADPAFAADQASTTCNLVVNLKDREIPPEIAKHLTDWLYISNADRIIQISLGIIGIVCSLIVSTFTESLDKGKMKMFSLTAALAFGLVGAFDIGGKADAARSGWRHLTTAILRFQTDPCFTISKLVDAYSDGEDMVGNVPLRSLGSTSAEPGSTSKAGETN